MKPNRSQQFVRCLAWLIYWPLHCASYVFGVFCGIIFAIFVGWFLYEAVVSLWKHSHEAMLVGVTMLVGALILCSYEWAKRKLGK